MEYGRLPDLKALATLRAVVERGGVSEAAELLNIGQPAVTKRLRTLDEMYGTQMMKRIGGRLHLTEMGKLVYQFASQTLDGHRILNQNLQNLKYGKQTLRLEVTMSIGEHFLPEWLVHFTDIYPHYRVESRLAYGRIIESHLATGQTDLAVLESAPDHPDILVQKWREDDLVLVCGPNHNLASEKSVTKKQLYDLTFVLREKNAAIRELLDKRFEEHQLYSLDVVMEVGSTDAITDILYRGRHVSFLPRFAIADDIQNGKLVPVLVDDLQLKRTLWIARNRSSQDHLVANAFIEMLRS